MGGGHRRQRRAAGRRAGRASGWGALALDLSDKRHMYWLVLAFVAPGSRWPGASWSRRSAQALIAVRESEERARAIGIDVTRHRRVALVFSGALAGLAGGLFAIYQNFVSPELLFFALSGEVVVIALLGGMGTLYGSLVGAVIAIGLREILSTYTDNWLVVLGALYVACVMCFPQGLTRLFARADLCARTHRRAREWPRSEETHQGRRQGHPALHRGRGAAAPLSPRRRRSTGGCPCTTCSAARHRVHVPVHPGFGASEGYDEIEAMDDLVFHTLDVMDALGLERVDVVGLSLGGWLAAELRPAAPGPGASPRAGGCGGHARAGRRARGSVHGPPREGPRAPVRRPESAVAAPDRARRAAARAARGGAARAGGRRARCCGTRPGSTASSRAGSAGSRRRPWSSGARRTGCCRSRSARPTSAGSPARRLETIDGCGHLPPFEQPERFARIVLDFLQP